MIISPKLFVINLPDAEVARYFCSEIINRIFRRRKSNFTLIPRIVFVFDEAQEFIPAEKEKGRWNRYFQSCCRKAIETW